MIIAECGQNFCGQMDLARALIAQAKHCGADLAKFQLYDHKILYKDYPEIPDVELSFDQAKMLFDYGQEVGIEVFFSVFDVEKVEWCEEVGVKRYKIANNMSGENTRRAIAATGKPVISSMVLLPNDFVEYKQLYCISEYPTPLSKLRFDFGNGCIGFSDHTIGLDAAKIALARGASIIEKHFCLTHDMGVDAAWSMMPDELRELKRWENVCQEVL